MRSPTNRVALAKEGKNENEGVRRKKGKERNARKYLYPPSLVNDNALPLYQ